MVNHLTHAWFAVLAAGCADSPTNPADTDEVPYDSDAEAGPVIDTDTDTGSTLDSDIGLETDSEAESADALASDVRIDILTLPESCFPEPLSCDLDVSGVVPFVMRDVTPPTLEPPLSSLWSVQAVGPYGEVLRAFSGTAYSGTILLRTYTYDFGCPLLTSSTSCGGDPSSTSCNSIGDTFSTTRSFDAHGRRLRWTSTRPGIATNSGSEVWTWSYDDVARTVLATYSISAMTHSYCSIDRFPQDALTLSTYDDQGNPIQRQYGSVSYTLPSSLSCQFTAN